MTQHIHVATNGRALWQTRRMTRVTSEIGRLRAVLVHRPGPEIARLTPENSATLLFDDILWLERAQEEHDRFAAILRSRDVEVVYFRDLLGEVLEDDGVRGSVIDEVVTPAEAGPSVAHRLREALRDCPLDDALDLLLSGVVRAELSEWGIDPLLAGLASDRHRAVIKALPNLLFMRDNAAWIGQGLALGVLARPARARESIYMEAIYRYHPRFRSEAFPFWYGAPKGDRYPASIEGGDVLVLDPATVLIGSGERTSPAAIEILAGRLFEEGGVERVIVAHMRRERSMMHLDTVVTMVDHDLLNVFPQVLDEMEVYVLEPGGNGEIRVRSSDGLVTAISKALGRTMRVVTTGGGIVERMREQWDDGNNTVAIAPGVVVAYARNRLTNERLREAGVEVLELDASELCRGRGGSRCMTQPLRRDPL